MTAEKRVAHINTYFDGPVWAYFCLTYSAYLVLPRVSLCSMPLGWQRRFVALMKQAEQMLPPELQGGEYAIQMRGPRGRFVKDPLCDYRHPPKVELREYMRGHVLRQAARDAGVTDDVGAGLKATPVENACTHAFRPIDSSGQLACIYCNARATQGLHVTRT